MEWHLHRWTHGFCVVLPVCILSHPGTLRPAGVLCGMGWGDEVSLNGSVLQLRKLGVVRGAEDNRNRQRTGNDYTTWISRLKKRVMNVDDVFLVLHYHWVMDTATFPNGVTTITGCFPGSDDRIHH
jgi:hypothetical protein